MMPKRVSVTSESSSGRDLSYHDNYTGQDLSRAEFVKAIKAGEYPKYHVRNINGVNTPASNPDSSTNNNLG